MSDLSRLQRRRDEIRAALERADDAPGSIDRDALRDTIVTLFRDTERVLAELSDFKQSIRPLVDRYRTLFPAAAEGADRGPSQPARPPRADHLGASTYLDRAWNSLATCRYEAALEEASRALERVPGDAQAETMRGWALMRMGRLEEARSVLQGVLARDAGELLARASLGYVAMRQGRFAEAIEHLSRAARSGADRKAALYANLYLGMVYTQREMYRDGRSFLSRALELGPHLVEAYWEMGRSYYLEGQFALALETWRRGAEVNRFNPWGERCREAVERATAGGQVLLD